MTARSTSTSPRLRLLAAGAFWILWIAPAHAGPGPSIRLAPPGDPRGVFEVVGLDPAEAGSLAAGEPGRDDWVKRFAVYTIPEGRSSSSLMLPLLGTYRVEAGVLRFRPRFPLEPGLVYFAQFRGGPNPQAGATNSPRPAIEATFALPKKAATPAAVVTDVHPSGETLPENLLKFYVRFSAPMSRGAAYDHIRLRDERGKDLDLPFLELAEELWDPAGRRLTLLFDPGRIKRGLKPREELGPVLVQGRTYTLAITPGWLDAEGQPLATEYRKTFRVGPPDDRPPEPSRWKVDVPAAASRDSLTITSTEPLDHALFGRLVTVRDAQGHELPGAVAVDLGETRWRFTPGREWAAGDYRIAVDRDLEDLAGNSVGRLFEVDVFDKVEARTVPQIVYLPFRVEPAPR
jgi:hypothetical protein